MFFSSFIYSQCDDLLESQCNNDDNCVWIENIEIEFCGAYNQEECLEQQGCWWYPGGWYLGAYCNGSYQVDNSFCEEASFIPGDVNSDGYINIMDVVMIMDFILTEEYDMYSDMNQDGILNIMDIIELVNMILEG